MKVTHPKQYAYCMNKLGMKEVLKWYPVKENTEDRTLESMGMLIL
jgi:hypothetical protein